VNIESSGYDTRESAILTEETLDPEDWDSVREIGHMLLNDMLDYLKTVQDRPATQPIPEDVKGKFRRSLPVDGQKAAEIYEEFSDFILPYPLGNIHPCF
jgi:hypothetical protein